MRHASWGDHTWWRLKRFQTCHLARVSAWTETFTVEVYGSGLKVDRDLSMHHYSIKSQNLCSAITSIINRACHMLHRGEEVLNCRVTTQHMTPLRICGIVATAFYRMGSSLYIMTVPLGWNLGLCNVRSMCKALWNIVFKDCFRWSFCFWLEAKNIRGATTKSTLTWNGHYKAFLCRIFAWIEVTILSVARSCAAAGWFWMGNRCGFDAKAYDDVYVAATGYDVCVWVRMNGIRMCNSVMHTMLGLDTDDDDMIAQNLQISSDRSL